MGYTTDFEGSLEITPALKPEQVKFINDFSSTRRMKRDVKKLNEIYKGEYGLDGKYGVDGEYFVLDTGDFTGVGIIDYNTPPISQPGLWCHWIVNEEGTELYWDGGEKFYNYTEWLDYMISHFFSVWGVTLNGSIRWQGEELSDAGVITVNGHPKFMITPLW